MAVFAVFTVTLIIAAFSLGAVTHLYIRHRTRFILLVMLFLVSLLAISAGFWLRSTFFKAAGAGGSGYETLLWLFQGLGSFLNIVTLPFLASALLSIPISGYIKPLLWVWNIVFLVSAVIYFILPRPGFLGILLMVQQLATIAGTLLFLGIGIRTIRKPWWRKAFTVFLTMSALFLMLLVLDILITLLDITWLSFFDGMSLPLYLAALSGGIFFYSGKYLSREAMVMKDKVTDSCITLFGLTRRETDIINEVLFGHTTREIGERLSISPKTVENHLYNIYQKLGVASRTQLLHMLWIWGRE